MIWVFGSDINIDYAIDSWTCDRLNIEYLNDEFIEMRFHMAGYGFMRLNNFANTSLIRLYL